MAGSEIRAWELANPIANTAQVLKFRPGVQPWELVGRLMGPDRWGARYVVTSVTASDHGTLAHLRPVPADESRLTRDPFGQWWVGEPPAAGTVFHATPEPEENTT